LSPQHREVIDLVYYHEKSADEVAHILDVPSATVKTRMFYSRKKLAEGPESLFDIVVANEYLQNVSNLRCWRGDDAPFKMLMPRSIRFGRTTIVRSPIRSLWQGTPRGERQQRQVRISGLYAALARLSAM